ncbi:hypothetical protein VKT23_019488 [Stygiomarasmius scandens]|uniref:Uncharacterized protein n=1 Tax=Marasmiellus scandens TaxID=2682957 RepID=A0ABR1IQJ3_9AGAR
MRSTLTCFVSPPLQRHSSSSSGSTLVGSSEHVAKAKPDQTSKDAAVVPKVSLPGKVFELVNLQSIGRLVLRKSNDIAVWIRLAHIRSRSRFSGSIWSDLIRFLRRNLYNASVRQQALQILLNAIETQPQRCLTAQKSSLVSRVVVLPEWEVEAFVSEVVACIPDDLLNYPNPEPVHEEIRTIYEDSSRRNQVKTRFASVLERIAEAILAMNAVAALRFYNLANLLQHPTMDEHRVLHLEEPHLLKLAATGKPMWNSFKAFFSQCSVPDAERAWRKMALVITHPSTSTAFLKYEKALCQYRLDVGPTLFFLEFCERCCPNTISSFCGAGLHSFLQVLLGNFIPEFGLPYVDVNDSSWQYRKSTLIETISQLIDRIEQDGYGDVELEQDYIVSTVFIALLAMSHIHNSQDETIKLRYTTYIRRMLATVRDRNVETWAAYVSHRTVSYTDVLIDSQSDPNILMMCFRIVERIYDSEIGATPYDASLECYSEILEKLCQEQALYEPYSLEYHLQQLLLVFSYT